MFRLTAQGTRRPLPCGSVGGGVARVVSLALGGEPLPYNGFLALYIGSGGRLG
jgi:hypothetical protein